MCVFLQNNPPLTLYCIALYAYTIFLPNNATNNIYIYIYIINWSVKKSDCLEI